MKELRTFITHRLVKSEDLNHHGTLFAGRTAEWFIESGFISATEKVRPEHLICLKIHGLHFTRPARIGDVICFSSKVVLAGTTSLTTYTKMFKRDNPDEVMVDGFTTFIHVNRHTTPSAHGIVIKPQTPEDKKLNEEAKLLKK